MEARFHEILFLCTQPCDLLREVRDGEEENDRGDTRHDALFRNCISCAACAVRTEKHVPMMKIHRQPW